MLFRSRLTQTDAAPFPAPRIDDGALNGTKSNGNCEMQRQLQKQKQRQKQLQLQLQLPLLLYALSRAISVNPRSICRATGSSPSITLRNMRAASNPMR